MNQRRWRERKLVFFAVLQVFNLKQLRYYGAAESLHSAAAGSNPINLGANERSPCCTLPRLLSVITLNSLSFGSGLCGLPSGPAEGRLRSPVAAAAREMTQDEMDDTWAEDLHFLLSYFSI